MKGLFDLIANYYLWILLGLAIIFFAYIGYSAEKKGYIGKKKKKSDDTLVDIDELIKPKEETTKPVENNEEDLSNSFDVMPEITKNEEEKKTETPVEEDISEDLYAPFGDQIVSESEKNTGVEEVEDETFNQDFVNINKIEAEAKDINNVEDKKDVAELMASDSRISTDFVVEGASDNIKSDNVFEKVAAEEKKSKKKKEEVVDDMWKF